MLPAFSERQKGVVMYNFPGATHQNPSPLNCWLHWTARKLEQVFPQLIYPISSPVSMYLYNERSVHEIGSHLRDKTKGKCVVITKI